MASRPSCQISADVKQLFASGFDECQSKVLNSFTPCDVYHNSVCNLQTCWPSLTKTKRAIAGIRKNDHTAGKPLNFESYPYLCMRMDSTKGKVVVCLAVTAFTGLGVYQLWRSSRKRRQTKDAAKKLISIFDQPNIHIKDSAIVNEKIRHLLEGGAESLQVISDFDMTLTRYFVNGKGGDTSHGSIEKATCMSEDFRLKACRTKEKYYPLEHSIEITLDEKIEIMTEWWETIHDLIINEGFYKNWIPGIVSECNIVLRDGADLFFRILDNVHVPLYIVSAGIGDIIEEAIRKQSTLYKNARIIANLMDFDEEGKLIGFKGDLIHSYNKHAVLDHIKGFVRHTKDRHNLILFGDTLGDPSMADGMIHVTNELKVGFLNYKADDLLEAYKDAYDIVLVDEENWDVINVFLEQLFSKKD